MWIFALQSGHQSWYARFAQIAESLDRGPTDFVVSILELRQQQLDCTGSANSAADMGGPKPGGLVLLPQPCEQGLACLWISDSTQSLRDDPRR
jgi:hypothetical protein